MRESKDVESQWAAQLCGIPDEPMIESVKAVVQLGDSASAGDERAGELLAWTRARQTVRNQGCEGSHNRSVR